jgi:hypothetical protein
MSTFTTAKAIVFRSHQRLSSAVDDGKRNRVPPASASEFWGAGDPPIFARRRAALAWHPSTFDEQHGAPLTIAVGPARRDRLAGVIVTL